MVGIVPAFITEFQGFLTDGEGKGRVEFVCQMPNLRRVCFWVDKETFPTREGRSGVWTRKDVEGFVDGIRGWERLAGRWR